MLSRYRVTAEGAGQSGRNAADRERHPLSSDEPDDVAAARAECHPDADLFRALADRVAHDAVHADRRERERDRRKGAQDRGVETRLRDRMTSLRLYCA
jgi:hypothetical protein